MGKLPADDSARAEITGGATTARAGVALEVAAEEAL
jgi:hypothetical protein